MHMLNFLDTFSVGVTHSVPAITVIHVSVSWRDPRMPVGTMEAYDITRRYARWHAYVCARSLRKLRLGLPTPIHHGPRTKGLWVRRGHNG
jgi:hypothetical protein